MTGKRVGCVLAVLAVTGMVVCAGAAWQVLKERHVVVYYTGAQSFARRVADKAEEGYARIAADLGFTRHDDFWLWERRARIYVYADRPAFQAATESPAWAAGKAAYQERAIHTFEGSQEFLDSVLAHELAHLVLIDFLGGIERAPLWMHEGIAQWQDRERRTVIRELTRRMAAAGVLTPLDRLTRMDVRELRRGEEAAAFYAQAGCLVGFLIESRGVERFRALCGQLRDGKDLDAALRFTYPDSMRSIADLERVWRASMEAPK